MSEEETAGTPSVIEAGRDMDGEAEDHAKQKTGFLHGPFRVEALFFLGLGGFFLLVALLYWFWGYHWVNGPEQSGTAMLVGTFLLGMLPGGYFIFWSHRMRLRVEDRTDATVEEGAGTIDAFPSSSIWPFVLGMGAFLVVLSLVFGFWLTSMGVPLILTALIGVTAESRRGGTV